MNIKNINIKELLIKLVFFFVGLWIIQIGVAMFLKINIGSDPFTVFTQGISKLLNISVGNSNRLLTFILFIAIFFIDRKNINIGTLLSVLFTGTFIDINMSILNVIPFDSFNIIIKILFFALACIPISIGFPILKSSNLGVSPNDLVYLTIVDHLHKPYSKVRIGTDIIYAVLGFLSGGILGIGTIICVLMLGPLIEFFLPRIDRYSNLVISKN